MTLYSFTVRLDRSPGEEGCDRLFEAGLDDCLLVSHPNGQGRLMAAREAKSMAEAILTVVADLEKAGFHAVGFDNQDFMNLADIGRKTGRTRESVRLLAAGKRGPGGFPAPVTGGATPLYSWAAVREWFRAHYEDEAAFTSDVDADTLAAADLLLRARFLAPNVSDLVPLLSV
jgi:hypothetical protein